jgi:hypothetical protein
MLSAPALAAAAKGTKRPRMTSYLAKLTSRGTMKFKFSSTEQDSDTFMRYNFMTLVVDRGVDLLELVLSVVTLRTGLQFAREKFLSIEQQSCTFLFATTIRGLAELTTSLE